MDKKERMKELVALLNKASEAYYASDTEIMSNYEYDKLYDELVALEEETGITLNDSPTVNVGFTAVDELPKERHEKPMLSLNKTKSREELAEWLNDKEGLLSWKLDGLTIVLTYEDGKLIKAVTRGNGEIGEVVTNNAKTFVNLPAVIPYKGKLILRGEAVITYEDFEKINEAIPEADAKYKNPRNLCSGSVRQLNNQITAARNVRLFAFSLVEADHDFKGDRENQFIFLKENGFEVVPYVRVNKDNCIKAIEEYAKKIETYEVPSDGLVLIYCDMEYASSLGRTAKFPRDAIAFKWADETAETVLREVEWSASRTGLINPVAIFDPVELEGTTVSRASLHNLSYIEDLKLGLGDRITVYKANMIIPQIAENLTGSGMLAIPSICPVCGGKTEIKKDNESKTLICINPECEAKKIKHYTLAVSRDALNIDGLSEQTLEKFIARGFIKELPDLFKLSRFKEDIENMEGFGEKSYVNLIEACENARTTTLARFLYALGIAGVGSANAKILARFFDEDYEKIKGAGFDEISEAEGFGGVLAMAVSSYFSDEKKLKEADGLYSELNIQAPVHNTEKSENISGKTFVITGSVYHFSNRSELKEYIEERGGKVSGSVSAKTDYLINNDVTSTSGKNKKAKELGVSIISEEDFLNL